jgi:5'-3' exonuclease
VEADICAHLPPGPRLLILDGNNIVRRIYEARRDAPAGERLSGALRASLLSMRRALREFEPTHAVTVFDFGGPTWRHEQVPGYSKGREATPSELTDGLVDLRRQVGEVLGVQCVAVPGIEADDGIAAIALRWCQGGHGACIVCSTDKDMLQLLAHGVHVRDHFARQWRTAAYVQEKFGVLPEQLGDFFALRGDATDGIPGVPGIGAATAADLLRRFGSLQACLDQARTIPGKPGRLLREGRRQAEVSRVLVSFKTDVPLGLSWAKLKVNQGAQG